MPIDTATIDRIVAGVLDQLAGRGESAQGETTAETRRRGGCAERVTLTESVVTEEVLLGYISGKARVVVSERAIVTPAAWDAARERGVEIVRASLAGKSSAGRASETLTAETHTSSVPQLIVVKNTDAVERLWEDLQGHWRRELLGGPDEAAALAISAVCRGETQVVVILAEQLHRAACLANRNDNVKAVALGDAGDVRQIRGQLRANVWCLDPTGRSWFELRNVFRAIINN